MEKVAKWDRILNLVLDKLMVKWHSETQLGVRKKQLSLNLS